MVTQEPWGPASGAAPTPQVGPGAAGLGMVDAFPVLGLPKPLWFSCRPRFWSSAVSAVRGGLPSASAHLSKMEAAMRRRALHSAGREQEERVAEKKNNNKK